MAKTNRSTGSTDVSLDLLDTLTASITQAQSILTAVRADVGARDGGALTPEVICDLLSGADSLLDRARESASNLQPAGQ